jgi:hypothetical protein
MMTWSGATAHQLRDILAILDALENELDAALDGFEQLDAQPHIDALRKPAHDTLAERERALRFKLAEPA